MRIDIVSIFPDYLAPLRLSLVGKAIDAGTIDLRVHDLREWTHDRHRTVDDTPYGGGPGMVMKPEPWGEALDAIASSGPEGSGPEGSGPEGSGPTGGIKPLLVIPTPAGRPFAQPVAQEWSAAPWLVFACGRYEGIDGRVAEHYAHAPGWAGVAETSIGDVVLAGGEAAVLVMVEAVARLLPGVLGNEASAPDDSFAPGPMARLVEGPVFTKPPSWRGLDVPEVLLSGNHGVIAAWRADQAKARTAERRPDLLAPDVNGTSDSSTGDSSTGGGHPDR